MSRFMPTTPRYPLHRTRVTGCGCEKCAEEEAEQAAALTVARGRSRLSAVAPLAPPVRPAARSRLAAATLGTTLQDGPAARTKVGGGVFAALDPGPAVRPIVKYLGVGLPILTGFLTAGPAGAVLFGILGYGNVRAINDDVADKP